MVSSAISPDRVSRAVAVETVFKNLLEEIAFLPMRIAIFAQGVTGGSFTLDKRIILSSLEAGQTYGFGSPVHLIAEQVLPPNGDGVGTIPVTVYPLADGTTAAVGTITVGGTTQGSDKVYQVRINEKLSESILIPETSTPAAAVALLVAGINAVVGMPALASDSSPAVDITAKAKGEYGNDLFVEVLGEEDGLTFTVVQPTGGDGNPDVQPALDQFADTWETLIINGLNIADIVALEKYTLFGEARWQPLKPKPFVCFTGNTESSVSAAVAVSDIRKTDRINCQLVAPGSKELPFVVAARELAKLTVIANSNPPTEYVGQRATGLVPGPDVEQWNDTEMEFAVKGGSSTVELVDNIIEMSDTVTFYHPTGDTNPAYRFVVTIIKVMNVTYNLRRIFESADWAGKVLIPDGQSVRNVNARRPSDAVAVIAKMIDQLALEGIISDPATAKKSITAAIVAPNRLDISFTYTVSGNTNQIAITQNWGFFVGSQVAA